MAFYNQHRSVLYNYIIFHISSPSLKKIIIKPDGLWYIPEAATIHEHCVSASHYLTHICPIAVVVVFVVVVVAQY